MLAWSLMAFAVEQPPGVVQPQRALVVIAKSADECERDWLARQDNRKYGAEMRRLCEELRSCEVFTPPHGVLLVSLVRRLVEKEPAELFVFKRAALMTVMNGLPEPPKGAVHDLVWFRTSVAHLACAMMQQARIQCDASYLPDELPPGASEEAQEQHERRAAVSRRVMVWCEQITTGLPGSYGLFIGDWYSRVPVDAQGAAEACLMFGLTREQQTEVMRLVQRHAPQAPQAPKAERAP